MALIPNVNENGENGFILNTSNNLQFFISQHSKEHPLGKGSFGTVYLATNKANTSYAVKQIEIEKVESVEKLNREIKILEGIAEDVKTGKGSNLLYSLGEARDSKYVYYITPYIDHKDLDYYIKKEREYGLINENESIDIIRQILVGYHYLHHNKIIHRDLKPANFFLMNKKISQYFPYTIYIGDFGTAKYVSNEEQTELPIGSKITMAPEIQLGDYKYTHQPDVYSLGCILYRLLNGDYPLHMVTQSDENGKYIEIKQPCSEFILHVLEGCLQVDPKLRMTSEDLYKIFNIESVTQLNKFSYYPFDAPCSDNKIYTNIFLKRKLFESSFKTKFLKTAMERGMSSIFFGKLKNIMMEKGESPASSKSSMEYTPPIEPLSLSQKIVSCYTPLTSSRAIPEDAKILNNVTHISNTKSRFSKISLTDILICPPSQALEFYKQVMSDHAHTYLHQIARKILTGNGLIIASDIKSALINRA